LIDERAAVFLATAIARADDDRERHVARGTADADAISAKTRAHEVL
jgi:hypothetical protein